MAGGPVRLPHAGVDFIQSGIYEFGYWCDSIFNCNKQNESKKSKGTVVFILLCFVAFLLLDFEGGVLVGIQQPGALTT